jgi:AcrR family transcriptional regulator
VSRVKGERDRRVDALLAATLEELRAHGYEGLTVRNAARRAGLAPATAYTYVGSKDHLVAELYWQRVQCLLVPRTREGPPATRLIGALDDLVELVEGEPALTAASTVAVLSGDPHVAPVRDRIGDRLDGHLADALGADASPVAFRVLLLAVSGALMQGAMGFLGPGEMARRLHETAHLLFG